MVMGVVTHGSYGTSLSFVNASHPIRLKSLLAFSRNLHYDVP